LPVDWVQTTTWGPLENDGEEQTNYARIPFGGLPHILASAYLNEVSTGELDNQAGVAVAAFKRFEFMDDNGIVQEQELTSITSWIDVPRCVSITIALDIRAATACGGWAYYYLS
jgi:hypothetical protein